MADRARTATFRGAAVSQCSRTRQRNRFSGRDAPRDPAVPDLVDRTVARSIGRRGVGRPFGILKGVAVRNSFDAISQDGLKTAGVIKDAYKAGEPICVPGEDDRILVPEHLLNNDLDLLGLDDPLPLALVASRDPESPMAIAAVTRIAPKARENALISGVVQIVGEVSRHPLIKECVSLIKDDAFSPDAVARVRRHAHDFVVRSRQQYAEALRGNLRLLLDGAIAPRQFVREFFDLTEAGNLRAEIRKKLILSLLLADTVRPSVKFLLLENFHRLARPIQLEIVGAVLRAETTRHTEVIKEELRWMVMRQGQDALAGAAA